MADRVCPIDDLDRIMQVMEASFDPAYGEAWTRAQVSNALLMGQCYYTLAGTKNQSEGFTLSRHTGEEEELLLIAVHPAARRRGIGEQLLEQLICAARDRGAQRLFLEMRENNPAIHLYSKAGFVPVGRRPDYYRDGSGGRLDAITLMRKLECSVNKPSL